MMDIRRTKKKGGAPRKRSRSESRSRSRSRSRSNALTSPTHTVPKKKTKLTLRFPQRIVLFLSAHGGQNYQQGFSLPKGIKVHMLSFIPHYGVEGVMHEQPFPETRQSIDEIALKLSGETLKARYLTHRTSIESAVQDTGRILKPIYVAAFHDYPAERQRFADGFKIVVPETDRTFAFRPNPREDRRLHPHYGLHILDVEGLPNGHVLNHFQAKNRPIPLFDDYASYDYGNITYRKDPTIQPIVDANFNKLVEAMEKRIPDVYIRNQCKHILLSMMGVNNKMCTGTLSGIVFLFTQLGFNEIYLIDPTCRSILASAETIASRIFVRRGRTDQIVAHNTPENDPNLIHSLHSPH
jgi:hypothetical protein